LVAKGAEHLDLASDIFLSKNLWHPHHVSLNPKYRKQFSISSFHERNEKLSRRPAILLETC
jgi:hypothetical protein